MKHSTRQDLNYQSVLREMDSLEALASTDWHSACCQMFALYSVAEDGYMHDICDGIDLWIFEKKLTPELVDHLRQLISNESAVPLKRHYEGWMNAFEQSLIPSP